MSTYDRVHEQITKAKQRMDKAIVKNEELRNKCIKALALCEAQLLLELGDTK